MKTKKEVFILVCLFLLIFLCSCEDKDDEFPFIESFTATPSSVTSGKSITLLWIVSNTDRAEIDNGIGGVELSGSRIIALNLPGVYDYTLTAVKGSHTSTATVSVTCSSIEMKLQYPQEGLYHSAFVFQGNEGWEDAVTADEVTAFETLVGKQTVWAYFSNNWFSGISFPADGVNTLKGLGRVPFIRMMARHEDAWENPGGESLYTMQNIIDGKFDTELTAWAAAARNCGVPLLVEFGTEVNGDWFPWNGSYHGAGTKNGYGDPDYPDGPERFRDAYRHIIHIFRNEGADNVTWFFHVNNSSFPEEEWNRYSYYYPGDDYIDWIGVSVYGPQTPDSDYESFTSMMDECYPKLCALSAVKPIALLEFGVCEGGWDKALWIADAFASLSGGKYPRLKAVSWWNEKWENSDGSWSDLTVNSSAGSLNAYKNGVSNGIFIVTPVFSGSKRK